MKTLQLIIISAITILASCTPEKKQDPIHTNFGIFETVSQNDLPIDFRDKILQANILEETNSLLPIVGYIQSNDSNNYFFQDESIKLLPTKYPINPVKNLHALVAVKKTPALNNSDIQNTKPNQRNVEIYFNYQGAKKWADLTKNNVGKMLAFSVNDTIYLLTEVNGEIRNGVAMITGLENEETAIEISNSINK
ncbi:MAG: hypothetical protein JW798_14770 [Prolixibacteraceae bacterium]|nr:hypothetical protein [Prolixibacteraceae bacterium]